MLYEQNCIHAREHEGTERDTEGVGCDMSVTKVISSFRKSVSRDVRTEYNLDLRFLVKFNDNGRFVVGTQTFFVGIQEVSARRLRTELINHNLYLFA